MTSITIGVDLCMTGSCLSCFMALMHVQYH